jgi:hypothetical protein
MWLVRFIAGLIILLLLTGCASASFYLLIRETGPKAFQVKICGERVQQWEVGIIYHTLASLTDEMIVPKLEIVIIDDQQHLGKTWNGNNAAGHLCLSSCLTRICIIRNELNRDTINHEAAHAYHTFLKGLEKSDRDGFNGEWLKIAGDVYNKNQYAPNGEGIVKSYARVNHMEDVAMWFQYCHAYLSPSNVDNFSYIFDCKTDPRYRQKLALLYKYKFLNKEDYEKLKPLFE